MKTSATLLLLSLGLAAHVARAEKGVIDLTTLENYANQSRPSYITRDNTPANNAITDRGATLGRVLFYDRRVSRNNTVSCASCHVQSRAFGDTASASAGVNGTTGRHAMRLINTRFAREARFFWDERATSLENQTTQPIKDHTEMGFSGASGDPAFADLVTRLTAIDEYRVLFAMTFGTATITETRIQQALAQFVRSIQSFDSRYDAGRALVTNDANNFPNFTNAENAGKTLFLNPPGPTGAGCAVCHSPPEFDIDPNSRNNGVIGSFAGGTDLTNTRSPSLRDLLGPGGSSNGAFMHNASLADLTAVINHYNAIPGDNTNLDARLRRPGGQVQNLNLTTQQKANLVAFMRTLTGSSVYTAEKWADPFTTTNTLALIVLPSDALSMENHHNGSATLSCQAAPSLSYQLQSSLDLQTWKNESLLTSDATGLIEVSIPTTAAKKFYRFTYTPPAS